MNGVGQQAWQPAQNIVFCWVFCLPVWLHIKTQASFIFKRQKTLNAVYAWFFMDWQKLANSLNA